MRILGIDPGLAIAGYGVIHADGMRLKTVAHGTVQTVAGVPFPQRLQEIYAGIGALIAQYRPETVAFEELFFSRNVTTAMQVGAARGVALLAAQQAGLPLFEYTPMQIKLAVTGNGHADKHQIQQMVKLLLGLEAIPRPDDAADALATAICHANTGAHQRGEYRIR